MEVKGREGGTEAYGSQQSRHPSLPFNGRGEDNISHARLALQRGESGPPPAQQHMPESLACVTSVCFKKKEEKKNSLALTDTRRQLSSSVEDGIDPLCCAVRHCHLVDKSMNCSYVKEDVFHLYKA